MGETEKPGVETAVVAPKPATDLPLLVGPRPGVKYPLQGQPASVPC